MFQTYFDLKRRPFASVPTPEDYFPADAVEAARGSLVRLIERQEGPAIVVGQVGIGKSLLCQLLAESFRHLCRAVVLPSGRLCTRRSLLQVILYELGLSYRDLDEGELRLSLIDHLTNRDLCPNGILLLVDEADNLTLALLDELRTLTNLTADNQACVRLVLFGTPRLEEKFTHPRLESFNQRLAGRFYLGPFRADETRAYVEQRLRDSGADPAEVFTPDAFPTLQRASGGIARLINQIADHAMVLAAADDRLVVDSASVEEAWADLQQLPAPFERGGFASQADFPADIIEFGELDAIEPDVGSRAEQQLSDIESHLKSATANQKDDEYDEEFPLVDNDMPSLMPLPPHEDQAAKPEVTLYFHAAHNPFGDGFDEEEVVADIAPASKPFDQARPKSADEKAPRFEPHHDITDAFSTPQATVEWRVIDADDELIMEDAEVSESADADPTDVPSSPIATTVEQSSPQGADLVVDEGLDDVSATDIPSTSIDAFTFLAADVNLVSVTSQHFDPTTLLEDRGNVMFVEPALPTNSPSQDEPIVPPTPTRSLTASEVCDPEDESCDTLSLPTSRRTTHAPSPARDATPLDEEHVSVAVEHDDPPVAADRASHDYRRLFSQLRRRG